MEQLLVRLKEAQEQMEKTLTKAIEASNKELKKDVGKMVASLTDSVTGLRSDVTRIEESFNSEN